MEQQVADKIAIRLTGIISRIEQDVKHLDNSLAELQQERERVRLSQVPEASPMAEVYRADLTEIAMVEDVLRLARAEMLETQRRLVTTSDAMTGQLD